jgi:hypothetical protein
MPGGVKAYRENNRVRIRWNAALDANGNPVAGYNIYRAGSPAGPYSKVNTELVTGTEFVDITGGVVIEEGGAAGGSYYGVTAVDSFGDESAQSLGISPASVASSAEAAVAACFVSTVSGSIPAGLFWILAIFTIGVVAAHWRSRNMRDFTSGLDILSCSNGERQVDCGLQDADCGLKKLGLRTGLRSGGATTRQAEG